MKDEDHGKGHAAVDPEGKAITDSISGREVGLILPTYSFA
jgi:hypothetical protein